MKKIFVILLLISLGYAFGKSTIILPSEDLQFIKQNRYHSLEKNLEKNFLEVKFLLDRILNIYFKYTTNYSAPFLIPFDDFCAQAYKNNNLLDFVGIVFDRIIRMRAFDLRLYIIDINSGKALDDEYTK